AMIAIGLAFVTFVVVMSVLLAAGVHVISSRRIKAIGALMLFIIPALAVVGMIGTKWGAARAHTYHYYPSEVQTALETTALKTDAVKSGPGVSSGTVKPVSKVEEAATRAAVIVDVKDAADEAGRKTDPAQSQVASVKITDGADHKDGVPVLSPSEASGAAPPL